MKYLACIIISLFQLPGTVIGSSITPQAQGIDETYSFESDFEGWELRSAFDAASLVRRSEELANDGVTSLRVLCPASFQHIMIERAFSVEPNRVYDVKVDYALATRVGLDSLSTTIPSSFGLVTGAFGQSPSQEFRKILSAIQGPANNGEETSGNYRWSSRSFAFTASTDEQGKIYVIIGLTSSEGSSVFYFDKVHVTINEKPGPLEFSSFEDGFDGWAANATDFELSSGSTPWSVTRNQQFPLDGQTSLRFDIDGQNRNGKVWIEKAFRVEPKTKYAVSVEYGFLKLLYTPHTRIITGVLRASPHAEDELRSAFQEEIGDSAYPLWNRKQYEFNVKSKKSAVVYVVIGIFAAKPASQTYHFDNVCITLTKR